MSVNSIIPVMIILLLLIIQPYWAKNIKPKSKEIPFLSNPDTIQRVRALNEAKIFLAPYKDIWRDLRLTNKYCSILLDHDGVTIRCIEKVKPYRKFQVVSTYIHTPQELWNLFCIYFSYNKSYNGVLEDCQRYHVSIIESNGNVVNSGLTDRTAENSNKNQISPSSSIKEEIAEKLDINNCSEIELTELPGVSIVLAKKAIKRREEISGFKSVDDFFKFMKLKPHMEQQLRQRIKVEKMKGSVSSQKHSERSVDF